MPKTLLVVDDEPLIRDCVVEAVGDDFDSVLEAEDGLQALEVASRERPDVVVMDLLMPRLNGIEACRDMRLLPGMDRVPIVVLTAQRSQEEARAAFEAGASDYLVKPFSISELRARLRTWALRGHDPAASSTRTSA